MSELDKKLKEIAENIVAATLGMSAPMTHSLTTADYVLLIKQAFVDAGWVAPTDIYELNDQYQKKLHALRYRDDCFMTGQEWYDRFLTEFQKLEGGWKVTLLPRMNAVKAAKKAAGIE